MNTLVQQVWLEMVSANGFSTIIFGVIISILIIIPFYYLAKLVKWQLKQRKV
jgi:hypothetical protein